METINYNQILLLLLQCLLVGTLLLFLFRLRTVMGLGLLFTAMGVFQYFQVFLTTSFFVEIAPGVFVSPGSSVLFTGSLFAILLVYIREDALEARKVIYAVFSANIVLTALQHTFSLMLEGPSVMNIYHLPKEFFVTDARVLLAGTVVLFIDAILLIIIFEFISRFVIFIFFRMFITMVIVLSLDSVLFALAGFAGTDRFDDILINGLISKNTAAIVYSGLFSFYITFFDHHHRHIDAKGNSFRDLFHLLTYRQKYERIIKEKELLRIQSENEQRETHALLEAIFKNISDVVFVKDNYGRYVYINKAGADVFGRNNQEMLGSSDADILSPESARTILAVDRRILLTGGMVTHDEEVITISGVKRVFSTTKGRYTDDQGNVLGIFGIARDITERKTNERATEQQLEIVEKSKNALLSILEDQKYAQELIRESEERWRSLVQNAPDTITLVDRNAKILFINRVPSNISKDAVIGTRIYDLMPQKNRDAVAYAIEQAFARCEPQYYQVNEILPDGENRWYDNRIGPIRENNTVESAIIITTDITEHKRAEEENVQSEKRNLAFGRMGQRLSAAHTTEEAGRIIAETADEIIGWDAFSMEFINEELNEQRTVMAFDIIDGKRTELSMPGNALPISSLRRNIMSNGAQILNNDSPDHLPGATPFGDVIRASATIMSAPIRWSSRVIGILSIHSYTQRAYAKHALDIFVLLADYCSASLERINVEEALRESESKFRTIIDSSPVPYALNDDLQNITFLNKAFVNIFGYSIEDIPTVSEWWKKAYPDEKYRRWVEEKWIDRLNSSKQSGAAFEPLELTIRCKNGTVRTALVAAVPIGEKFKDVHLVILYDISDRKNAEEELQLSHKQLQQVLLRLGETEEMIRRKASQQLHDQVGQNLTALTINLNYLQSRLLPESKKQLEKRLADSLVLLNDTIERTRDIMMELRPVVLDEHGLFAALKWYGAQFEERTNISVTVNGNDLHYRLPDIVKRSLFRITQEVFTNIAKHAQASAVDVSLVERDGVVQLIVHDNGIGFNTVNEPHQLSPSLGLVSMRERAKAIEGALTIESSSGKGTTISISVKKQIFNA